jgi:transcription initiation factor TFIIIB Brf1 subunit/transcription initiation factor TFIIB
LYNLIFDGVLQDKAKELYKASYLEGLSRLGSKEILVAASVYYACISQRCPRSLSEVSVISGLSSKKIGKMFQIMTKSAARTSSSMGDSNLSSSDDNSTGIEVISSSGDDSRAVTMSRVLPEDVVSRVASFLRLPGPLICVAREVCAKVTKLELADGSSPQSVAAAVVAILVIAKAKGDMEQCTCLDRLSTVAFCTVGAIQKAYGLLRPHILLILPQEFVKNVGGVQHVPVDMPNI